MDFGEVPAPLWQGVREYAAKGMIPFHTPGHNGGSGAWLPWCRSLEGNIMGMDLTELPGLDDLARPEGIIYQAQELAARFFGAGQTFFLVNGVTVGIQACIMALCQPGDLVLIPRHAHRSVWSALILSGAKPIYVLPEWHGEWGIPLGVTAEKVKATLEANGPVSLVIMVNPTYEGLSSPLGPIVEAAHFHGAKVIVDEAHGAHYQLHHKLPPSAMEMGADVAVQGTHKVLGSLTQSAMLHLRHGFEAPRLPGILRLLQTTSPSYLLLSSLDAARAQAQLEGKRLFQRAICQVGVARQLIKGLPGFKLLEDVIEGYQDQFKIDPTRLVISALDLGIDGFRLAEILRRFGIEVELAGERHVVLLSGLRDRDEDWQIFYEVLIKLSRGYGTKRDRSGDLRSLISAPPPLPRSILAPREAFLSQARQVTLMDAVGQIATEIVAPYPPGVPWICPGEVYSQELVERLSSWLSLGGRCHGLGIEGEVLVVDG